MEACVQLVKFNAWNEGRPLPCRGTACQGSEIYIGLLMLMYIQDNWMPSILKFPIYKYEHKY